LTVNSSISPISVNLMKELRKFKILQYKWIVQKDKIFTRNRLKYIDNLTDIGYILNMG
jgi:hypothetical protein